MEAGVIRLTFMAVDLFPITYALQTPLAPNKEYSVSERLFYTVTFQQPEALPRPEMLLGTVEGHALRVYWDGFETETGEAVTSEISKYKSFSDSVHDSPVTSVSRSTFSPDLVLTVSARVFAIWREDFKDEPLLWRKSRVRMSCGRWSLYRSSSFLICHYDGTITTWDILLRSDNHIKEQPVSGLVVTGSYPSKIEPYQHIMAFADFMGAFRLFIVPKAYMEYDEDDEEAVKHFFSREVDARNAFRSWGKQWWEKNASIFEEEQAAREEEEEREKLEEEKRQKEEAQRAIQEEQEEKKRKKKEAKVTWTERYQKKWEEFQESNMMKVIMTLKHFRRSELLSKLQPLEALQEEEEKKKLKHKERLDQAQKLFEDLVFLLFPGTVDAPQAAPSAEVLFTELEDLPSKVLDAYKVLEEEALSYIAGHEFSYDFSWRTVLNEGLQRRQMLDDVMCPRAYRNTRFKEEKINLFASFEDEEKEEGAEAHREESGEVAPLSVLPQEEEAEGEPEEQPDTVPEPSEDEPQQGAELVAPPSEEAPEEPVAPPAEEAPEEPVESPTEEEPEVPES